MIRISRSSLLMLVLISLSNEILSNPSFYIDNTKIIGHMLKGETSFDENEAKLALERLSSLSLKTPKVFEVNAADPKSEAKPTIWDEFDEFTKLSQDLAETTEVLAGSVGTINDLRPALKRVSSGCKACHSKYRE